MPFKDPEKKRNWTKSYYQKHKEAINIRAREWKKNHYEQYVLISGEWRQKNKEYRRKQNREYLRKLRNKVLTHYGGNPPKCTCCGETEIEFLTIDHINNDGAEHRRQIGRYKSVGSNFYKWLKQNNFPKGFQVLCYNCNCGRGKNYGICPHKKINDLQNRHTE